VARLEVDHVVKAYGVTTALRGLSLTATSGEILGVAGPNGAGKSTLIRVLAGEEPPTEGEVILDGRPWPLAERRAEVAVVHQESQLFPNLTVGENVMVGRSGGVGRPRLSAREREILAHLRLLPYADRPLDRCSLVVSQLTEIARALLRDARLFLFDEPNSALTDQESAMLFAEIDRLKQQGDHIVLFVSHRLAELVQHCDRVAIVREGDCAGILSGDRLTEEALAAELVVGHPASTAAIAAASEEAAQAPRRTLQLSSLTHPRGQFRDVTLEIPSGAVTAITGVEGSGARELVRAIAGMEPARGGRTLVEERSGSGRAAPSGTAYVPAERRDALFFNFSVGANEVVRLGRPEIATRLGWMRRSRITALAARLSERFRVKTASTDYPVAALSGGNQQKVALASAMASSPGVLVVEEPTRGVDVGTKADIYQFLREFAAAGNIVVMMCTEVTEIFDAADQVCVMSRGRLSPPLRVASQPTAGELAMALASRARLVDQAAAETAA
jgi:ABC-type sugar transport system ATPase subunit